MDDIHLPELMHTSDIIMMLYVTMYAIAASYTLTCTYIVLNTNKISRTIVLDVM